MRYFLPKLLFSLLVNLFFNLPGRSQTLDYLSFLGKSSVEVKAKMKQIGYTRTSLSINDRNELQKLFEYQETYVGLNKISDIMIKYKDDSVVCLQLQLPIAAYPDAMRMLTQIFPCTLLRFYKQGSRLSRSYAGTYANCSKKQAIAAMLKGLKGGVISNIRFMVGVIWIDFFEDQQYIVVAHMTVKYMESALELGYY